MKKYLILASFVLFRSLIATPTFGQEKRIIKVPAEFPTIAEAVASSNEGNWIIISPGLYYENEIEVNKAILISSEWKISGDESKIDQTIIDSDDKKLFIINADGVEVSGLKIINGDHTLDISANVTIFHNHFINNLDGMSFESGGGGYVRENTAENDRDDALDLDIVKNKDHNGTDILVEHNTFINCDDDGIEIRLFTYPDQNIHYTIRENLIVGSNNAGIQLISYDQYTGKVFSIHHNIITNCKVGLGCMEGAKTREDLSGASKMNESVYFFNNTLVGNDMGATGGNNIKAFNNLVVANTLGGFKLFRENSAIVNNLFFQNRDNDLIDIETAVLKQENIFSTDPLLDKNSFQPGRNSPCIDAGVGTFKIDGDEHVKISPDLITGKAPDIGAIENGIQKYSDQLTNPILADAGEDRVVESQDSKVVLVGRLRNADDMCFDCIWRQEAGPEGAELISPDQLITQAFFNQEGIYQFSLNCSDGKSSTSDVITIRYINDGDGKRLFLGEVGLYTIVAEEFAYTYGKVYKQGKKYLKLEGSAAKNEIAQIEFSIGMAEGEEYNLWFLMKSLSPQQNHIVIEFNHKVVGEIPVFEDNKFHWVKVPGKIITSPGQWQLLISNLEGTVLLHEMIMTADPNYLPR